MQRIEIFQGVQDLDVTRNEELTKTTLWALIFYNNFVYV